MANTGGERDPLTRGLGVAIAVGALAAGAVAAFLNNERARQMRDDLQRQINDLSGRLDHELEARRPEIEGAIQRGRQAAVEGLDRMKGVVEQSADKAQDYVQKASVRITDSPVDVQKDEPLSLAGGPTPAMDTLNSVTPTAEDTMSETSYRGDDSLADATSSGQGVGASSAGDTSNTTMDSEPAPFSDIVGSAGGTIGSATVADENARDEAMYNSAEGTTPGEGTDFTPGMADYDVNNNADTTRSPEGDPGEQLR